MKRKVIQLAHKTLVVSLPSRWAALHGIRKGQEIEVSEKGSSLMIGGRDESCLERKSVNVSSLDLMLVRTVAAAYKAGYDEVELMFDAKTDIGCIQDVLRKTWIGFEVVSQGRHSLVAREISRPNPEEFDIVHRRLFLFMLSIADEAYDAIASRDSPALANLVQRDENINRFADFCRRVLNKGNAGGNTAPLYCIVEQLEKIGDIYRDLCKLGQGSQACKVSCDLLKLANSFLREFYELYYGFEYAKLEAFGRQKQRIDKALSAGLQKARPGDLPFLLLLSKLIEDIYDMNGPLLTAKV